jgi:hypothetical protein
MKCERVRGETKRSCNVTGREAIRTRFDQQPEHVQPAILGERRQRRHGIYLFHISSNMELFFACQ